MSLLRTLVRGLDWFVDQTGKLLSWLIMVIIFSMMYEVIARYVFNRPTAWSYDISTMLCAVYYLFLVSYTALRKAHIRVDIFYARFSARAKRIIDLVFTPLLLWTALTLLLSQSWKYAFFALRMGEKSTAGIWEPTMIPIRFAVSIGFTVFAIQAITWFAHDLYYVITGKELQAKG